MRTTAVAAALVVLTLSACGDGGEEAATGTGTDAGATEPTETGTTETDTGATSPPPVELEGDVNDHGTARIDAGEVEVEADDLYFEPTYIEVTEPGGQATVHVRNEGDVEHTFTIEDQTLDLVLSPGAEAEATVRLPDSGTLEFTCRFHEAQGMRGTFFVR